MEKTSPRISFIIFSGAFLLVYVCLPLRFSIFLGFPNSKMTRCPERAQRLVRSISALSTAKVKRDSSPPPKVSTINQWARVIFSTNWLRFLDWNLKAHSLDKDTFSRNNHGFSGKCIAVRSIHSNFSHWWKKWMELLYFTLWAFESVPFSCLLLDRCI